MAVLRSVVRRMAAVVRAFGASYVVVQVAIWHVYYAAHPWLLAGPLATLAWGGAAAAYLRCRRPGWPLIVLDTSFYAALAVTAGACVPPDMRGVAGNWLYIAAASQVVVTVWFAPRVLAVLLGLAPEAAYWAGAAVTPPGPAQENAPVVSGFLLLVVLAVHWTGRGMLYRRAARADLGFAAVDQEAHDQCVVLSRNIERREHERLLHLEVDRGPDPGGLGIPVLVAGAIVHATREALANVAAHAGTGEAWVGVTLGPGTLDVTVRDAGAGFDPARVDPARLGLRRSITERVADRGGRVSVRSAPGQGTMVSMSWSGIIPAARADLVAVDSSW
jgi:hypothetical protein